MKWGGVVAALLAVVIALVGVSTIARATGGDGSGDTPEVTEPAAAVAKIGETEYTSLDDAVAAAADGDTITVLGNCSSEGIERTTGDLVFEAQEGTRPVVEFNNKGIRTIGSDISFLGLDVKMTVSENPGGEGSTANLINASELTLSNTNMTIVNDEADEAGESAIYLYMGANLSVKDGSHLTITGFNEGESSGIYADGSEQGDNPLQFQIAVSDYSTIEIKDCAWGGMTVNPCDITVSNNSNILISECGVNGGKQGLGCYYGKMTIQGQSKVDVSDNVGADWGIFIKDLEVDGTSTLLANNNSGDGIDVGGVGKISSGAKVEMSNNDESGMWVYLGDTWAGDVTIDSGAYVTADNNGNDGITNRNVLTIQAGANVDVSANGDSGVQNRGTFKVAEGANVTVDSNKGSGVYNEENGVSSLNGNIVISNNADSGVYNLGKLSMTSGSVQNNSSQKYGGGIHNGNELEIASTVPVYNNHADLSGDDIYNRDGASITFGSVGTDWALDGDPDCTDAIDGWYDDSTGARWEAHRAPVHAEEFTDFNGETGLATVTGLKALKAAHGLIPLGPDDPSTPGYDTSKSKSATNLDDNFESNVTLSLPSAEEELVSDVVFVLDKSTSTDVEDSALAMLKDLGDQASRTGAKVKVGVVIFNSVANIANDGNFFDLATQYDDIEAAIREKIESGTNMHAGLLAANEMLENDTDVADSRKYVVLVSDGMSYYYCNDGDYNTAYTISSRNGGDTGTGGRNEQPNDGLYAWECKYDHGYIPDWNTYFSGIEPLLSSDYQKYEYRVDDPNRPTTNDYDSEGSIPYSDNDKYPINVDMSLYYSNQLYQEMNQRYHCYALRANEGETQIPFGGSFMDYLANGEDVSFESIENDIYYLLDKGTEIVDVIGYGTYDDGTPYDFSFVDDADRISMTVGDDELSAEKIETGLPENATSGYGFGEADGGYAYELYYYANGRDGASDECFVWKTNVPVSNFARVQVNYTVRLNNPRTDEGLYGTYDEYGVNNASGLLTNASAVLYPVATGNQPGVPEEFRRPTVSYAVGNATIQPADLTIYMGGDEGYEGVVNDTGTAVEGQNNSLPEPGFYITLPSYVNDALYAAGLAAPDAPANLSDLLTITAQAQDGTGRTWTLEPYGDTPELSSASAGYIYRVVPAEGQDPVRLEFTDAEGNTQVSDSFEPSTALYNTYGMDIYSGGVDMGSVKLNVRTADGSIDFTCGLNTQPGELTIRYVTGDQADVVTDVVAPDELAAARAENPDGAYAVLPDGTTYTINDSTVDVALDGPYAAAPSLLFDNVVSDHNSEGAGAYDDQLAVLTMNDLMADGVQFENPYYQAKYLDLVDANNGNVWLSSSNPIDVYWPYPEGTDENTTFYLMHFEGLHREMENGEISGQIDNAVRTDMEVENTEYGIKFTTDGFSPFVLMWDAGTDETGGSTEPPTSVEPPTPKPVDDVKPAGDGAGSSDALPDSGDATSAVLPVAALCGGAALVAAGLVLRRRRQ